jgi:hypothetical protein
MSLTSIYYVKQDNTIWGCGEPGCCGEYYEEIDEDFVKCDHDIPESEMTADHLQSCKGGGEILEWRRADLLEMKAFWAGNEDGWNEGWNNGAEWQEKQQKLGGK